jgi:GNAT superfamily N-acetyltransferase
MPFRVPVDSIHDTQPQLSNLRSYWLGWGSSDGVDDDLPIYHSGLPHPLLNGVLRVRDQSVDNALARARQRLGRTPHLWWIGADSAPGTLEQLLARGAEVKSTLPVMAIDLARVTEVAIPGLEITRVVDQSELTEYVETYAEVFGIPHEARPAVVDAETGYATAHSAVTRFVGRMDGQVVGTAQLSVSHGVAGVYWVAKREAYRGRGIATALTAAALLTGRQRGLRIGSLQASGLGEPVYRRLGFETVDRLHHVSV